MEGFKRIGKLLATFLHNLHKDIQIKHSPFPT